MSASTSAGPLFPAFLLPSFTLPFRRRQARRPTQSTTPGRPPVDTDVSAVPSLSSSPTSTLSDSVPTSPADLGALSIAADCNGPQDGCGPPFSNRGTALLHRVHPDIIRCGTCAADLAFGAQIVSKGFTGRYGRAYLVSPPSSLSTTPPELGLGRASRGGVKRDIDERDDAELANIVVGRSENRQLVTGAHVVADISCAVCGAKIGWKYVEASEASQKYKEGKFILEIQRVVVHRSWEDVGFLSGDMDSARSRGVGESRRMSLRESVDSGGGETIDIMERCEDDDDIDQVVVFDSEDEDECEDIFSGTWDPAAVIKRRRTKVSRRGGKMTSAS